MCVYFFAVLAILIHSLYILHQKNYFISNVWPVYFFGVIASHWSPSINYQFCKYINVPVELNAYDISK